jgi:NhaP-type Na+/H+ or K+/H+ antiporter
MFDNQVWLALALIGTFLTIFVVGIVVDMMLNTKRRYATVLQTQVGATPDSFSTRRQVQL